MKENQQDLLLIFTRNPEYGKVKTRIAKEIGEEKALNIYKFLLNKTLSATKNLDIVKEVFYSEEIIKNDIWPEKSFRKSLQKGKDLGERMENAFKGRFLDGFEKIIIIGSDLYDLEKADLEQAFQKLDKSDFVLGPAKDGGYYLLGMKSLSPQVFRRKSWGTSTVLRETLEDLKGQKIAFLEERNDIDTFDDIKSHPDFQKFW